MLTIKSETTPHYLHLIEFNIYFNKQFLFLVGFIRSRLLSQYNSALGQHYDAIFEGQHGSEYAIKYNSNCNITHGFKHIIKKFQIKKLNNKQTCIFE